MRNANEITTATARATLAALLSVKNPEGGSYAAAFQDWCEYFCWDIESLDEEWTEAEKITAYLNNDPAPARERIGVTEGGAWGIAVNNFYIAVDSLTFVEAAIHELTPQELFGEEFFESIDD